MNFKLLKQAMRTIRSNSLISFGKGHKDSILKANNGVGSLTIRDSDIFLVSYPKSGNTWMRFLVANLLRPNDTINFVNIETIVPDIYKNTEDELSRLKAPRIIKSHECFNPRYKKVIHIVRNPLSIAVSFYHHLMKFHKISEELPFKEFLNDFLKGNYMTIIGNWNENVLSWITNKSHEKENYLLVRYEDLHQNLYNELKSIAVFLGIFAESAAIDRTIELSSFENMKKHEVDQRHEAKIFVNGDHRKMFCRSGTVDEWKDYFDNEGTEMIRTSFGEAMDRLGYCCDF